MARWQELSRFLDFQGLSSLLMFHSRAQLNNWTVLKHLFEISHVKIISNKMFCWQTVLNDISVSQSRWENSNDTAKELIKCESLKKNCACFHLLLLFNMCWMKQK